MTLLATIRHQHRTRAGAVFALLVVVWLNVALQGCAVAGPDTLLVDRHAESSELDPSRTHSNDALSEQCPVCPVCEHDGCTDRGSCDGPVVVGTKVESRFPETHEPELTAAVAVGDLEVAFKSRNTSPNKQLSCRVTTAAVPLTIRYCVYLI